MTARKKAEDIMFWARQFAHGGNPKWTREKQLACEIHNAQQISYCVVGEIEKEVKKKYKVRSLYKHSKEAKYWKKVFEEIGLYTVG